MSRSWKRLKKPIFFCSLLDTGRGGAHLCGGESTGYRKPVYKAKDGSRYSGIQAETDESQPYQPEIPP